MTPFVLGLRDPQATPPRVGGKGASLTKMANARLPVPHGFHVTTDAYRVFVVSHHLDTVVEEALAEVEAGRPATLERAAERIRSAFLDRPVPDEVIAAITSAYRNLSGDDPSVAVRSSATAEDLPEASFAGQLETYLDVSGVEAVLDATRRCWSSLWTARAIGYRERQGITHEDLAVGVVVQELVDAEVAGILFTVDPMGAVEHALVSASWGLGDAVVGGRVTPDRYVVEKATGRVVDRTITSKEVMTVRIGGGTEDQPVPVARRMEPALDEAQLATLIELGSRIEALFGVPMDVEWALADDTLVILQARPITTLHTTSDSVDWSPPEAGTRYMRASVIDFMPNPISPLFETMGLPIYGSSLRHLLAELTGTGADYLPDDLVRTIHRYAYMRVDFSPSQWLGLLFVMMPGVLRAIRNGPDHYRDTAFPGYRKKVEALSQPSPADVSAHELWSNAQELMAAAAYFLSALQVDTLGASAGSEGLFTLLYERSFKRDGDPRAAEFLMGYDSTSIRAEKAAFDLATWSRTRPDLARYLLETSTAVIRSALDTAGAPEGVPADAWNEWVERIAEHQSAFGHILFDFDFAWPVPAEDPGLLIESVRMFLRGEGSNPHDRHLRLETARLGATTALLARARGARGWAVTKALKWAQSLAEVREDSIASIGLAYPRLRLVLRELGLRLTSAGVIADPSDVFWLLATEVEASLPAADRSESLPSMQPEVDARRTAAKSADRLVPPASVPPSERYLGLPLDVFIPGASLGEEEALKGVAASPGKVTGIARVLHGPEDFDLMEQNAVLVAKATTPAWTPLFAMAGGIVTDIGGPLSHGSIVAREYGIPAVLGTVSATRVIRSGQRITVDGDTGVITLHDTG